LHDDVQTLRENGKPGAECHAVTVAYRLGYGLESGLKSRDQTFGLSPINAPIGADAANDREQTLEICVTNDDGEKARKPFKDFSELDTGPQGRGDDRCG